MEREGEMIKQGEEKMKGNLPGKDRSLGMIALWQLQKLFFLKVFKENRLPP